MKKLLLILTILLFTACSKETKETDVEKISSTGELLCVYKQKRTSENTIYTSYYLYKFDKNGILNGAINNESIEFEKDDEELKSQYREEVEETIKDYEDIEGVKISKNITDDKYSFEIKMDNKNMDEETKEEFFLNLDRINLYKLHKLRGYTCE